MAPRGIRQRAGAADRSLFAARTGTSFECGNAIWRHVQLGEVDPAEISRAWAVLRGMPVQIVASDDLVERALDLAVVLEHPIYDCLYPALALDRGALAISADRRFITASRRRSDLDGAVVLLSDLAH